jgi:ABC-type branched-subunit amino acid transport system ATPase component
VTRLALTNVVAGYGYGDILRSVDIEVTPGAITCIVGPNGAGKSTILRVVSGLLHPRIGSIVLGDHRIERLSPRQVLRLGVVQVPQERSLFPLMTVRENVLIGAYIRRDGAASRRRVDELAERFPIIRERGADRAGSLSGGQQKIVEIARALMLDPEVIMLDEPSMGLDPNARKLVFEIIRGLNADAKRTVVLVEQNARAGLHVADVGVIMDAGRVALTAPAASMIADPRLGQLYLGGHVASTTARPQS